MSASILSQAGYSVLLIEKGPYVSRLNTSQLEGDAPNSSEFNLSQEVVLNRIGAIRSDTIHHNGMNAKLIQGSKALGHKYFETKQNLKDTKHDSAGYTCFGDR